MSTLLSNNMILSDIFIVNDDDYVADGGGGGGNGSSGDNKYMDINNKNNNKHNNNNNPNPNNNPKPLYPILNEACNRVVKIVDKCLDKKWYKTSTVFTTDDADDNDDQVMMKVTTDQDSCCKAKERQCSHRRIHRMCYETFTDVLGFAQTFDKCQTRLGLNTNVEFCQKYQQLNTIVNQSSMSGTCRSYIPCFDNLDVVIGPSNKVVDILDDPVLFPRPRPSSPPSKHQSMTTTTTPPSMRTCMSTVVKLDNCLIRKWNITKNIDNNYNYNVMINSNNNNLTQTSRQLCCYQRERSCSLKKLLNKCNLSPGERLDNDLQQQYYRRLYRKCNNNLCDQLVDRLRQQIDGKGSYDGNDGDDSACTEYIPCLSSNPNGDPSPRRRHQLAMMYSSSSATTTGISSPHHHQLMDSHIIIISRYLLLYPIIS
ncbi:putative uncharacterized protein DDB_G0279653 [Oppia nitens]|uniref:putative uncharacterized protein DDB_G0279653 n=1 Tax=Oppia nitens TaxID=1686743 RepID=UPI0023DB0212|nr:putative uncharacterized protein DDB_G0279653 [Oppia nitens]